MEQLGTALTQRVESIILHAADPITQHGFTQVPNVILKHPRLSFGAKMTYAMFLSYAWHNQYCFPGQKRLGDDLGVKERQVRNFINELKQAQLLTVERRGLGQTNIYHLFLTVEHKKGKPSTRQAR